MLPLLLGEAPLRAGEAVGRTLYKLAGISPDCPPGAKPTYGDYRGESRLLEIGGRRGWSASVGGWPTPVGLGNDRSWGEWFEVGPLRMVVIPYPSGRNLVYNDGEMRELAGRVLREARA